MAFLDESGLSRLWDHIVSKVAEAKAYAKDYTDTKVATKSDTSHSHSAATTSADGFMSAAMVQKLNGIDAGANKTTVDSSMSASSTNPVQNKIVKAYVDAVLPTVTTADNGKKLTVSAGKWAAVADDTYTAITNAEIDAAFNS